jgi:hypothetical protein
VWHALDQESQTSLVAAVHAGCLDVVAVLGAERSHMHYKLQWAAQHGHLQVSFAGVLCWCWQHWLLAAVRM